MVDAVFISVYSDLHCYNIRRLSAFLKKKGFTTRIIFLPQPFSNKYSKKVLEQMVNLCKDTKLICVSLMTNYWDNANQVTAAIKKKLSIPIIWGGTHPTIMPDECLDVVNMIGISEGDETLSVLLEKIIKKDHDYSGVPNLYYKKDGKIHKNELKRFEKMDEIPVPDYDLEDHYVLFGNKIRKMTMSLFRCFYGETYATMCTFGCPFSCTYCCNNNYNKLFKFGIRKRKMEAVIDELKYIKAKFPFISRMRIGDDLFFSCYSKEEFEYFRDSYKKYIGMPLTVVGGHPNIIKKDIMKILVDAGMNDIGMGIQTGSNNTKKLFNRMISNETIIKACKTINSFKGLSPVYDIIIDVPWESDGDKLETLNLILEIPKPRDIALFSLTFFPGTDLFEKALAEGIIKDVKNEVYRKHYYAVGESYLTLLFPIFVSGNIPKGIKRLLINKKLVNSKYKNYLKPILKIYPVFALASSLLTFFFHHIIRFDVTKTMFLMKKFYYDFIMNKKSWRVYQY